MCVRGEREREKERERKSAGARARERETTAQIGKAAETSVTKKKNLYACEKACNKDMD